MNLKPELYNYHISENYKTFNLIDFNAKHDYTHSHSHSHSFFFNESAVVLNS